MHEINSAGITEVLGEETVLPATWLLLIQDWGKVTTFFSNEISK
jgi:hypothetical protein